VAGGGGDNPPSRRAVCDERKHGSVGAGAGATRPGYPTLALGNRGAARPRRTPGSG